MKFKLIVLSITILSIILYSIHANGIWTYAEDIRAGTFGERENNPEDIYIFNNRVIFNNNTFTNRIEGIDNSTYRVDLRDNRLSRFSGVMSNVYLSPNTSYYLVPEGSSILRDLEIRGDLIVNGNNILDLIGGGGGGSIPSGTYVLKSGDNMTGDLRVDAEVIANRVIANRFIDAQDPNYLLNPSQLSSVKFMFAEGFFSRGGGNLFYLRPAYDSNINNLNIEGELTINGNNVLDLIGTSSGSGTGSVNNCQTFTSPDFTTLAACPINTNPSSMNFNSGVWTYICCNYN